MTFIYYLDNYGNSRANTCVQTWLLGKAVLIRYRTDPGFPGFVLIHDAQTDCTFTRQRVIQVSDLSASDGRVLAYRGFDG